MRRWAFALGLIFALAFAYDVSRIPVQVPDSLGDILEAQQEPSAAAAFVSVLHSRIFLRPLKAAQIRAVSDISSGEYTLAYRSVHVVLLVLTVLMFVRAMQVRTGTDLAVAAFALTVFLGLHTFANLLKEAYPINHFLEIVLFALVALNLAQGPPRWTKDAAAAVTFAAAALIVESGLLIWVVIVGAYLSGMRGISRRGVILVTVMLGVYACARVFVFSVAMPGIDERSSGYLLRVLEPEELRARFGEQPSLFFAYNIASAALSVFFAEPRAGWWVTANAYFNGEVLPWMWVALISSSLTTVLIAWAAVSSWRQRAARDETDRLFLIAAAVIAANAVLTYAYLKDELMSLAGAFYALAAYAAVRRLVAGVSGAGVAAVLCVLLFVASAGWAMRTAGLHYGLRTAAFKTRNDWTAVSDRWMATPEWRAVTERLRSDAFAQGVVAPRFEPRWETQWFEE